MAGYPTFASGFNDTGTTLIGQQGDQLQQALALASAITQKRVAEHQMQMGEQQMQWQRDPNNPQNINAATMEKYRQAQEQENATRDALGAADRMLKQGLGYGEAYAPLKKANPELAAELLKEGLSAAVIRKKAEYDAKYGGTPPGGPSAPAGAQPPAPAGPPMPPPGGPQTMLPPGMTAGGPPPGPPPMNQDINAAFGMPGMFGPMGGAPTARGAAPPPGLTPGLPQGAPPPAQGAPFLPPSRPTGPAPGPPPGPAGPTMAPPVAMPPGPTGAAPAAPSVGPTAAAPPPFTPPTMEEYLASQSPEYLEELRKTRAKEAIEQQKQAVAASRADSYNKYVEAQNLRSQAMEDRSRAYAQSVDNDTKALEGGLGKYARSAALYQGDQKIKQQLANSLATHRQVMETIADRRATTGENAQAARQQMMANPMIRQATQNVKTIMGQGNQIATQANRFEQYADTQDRAVDKLEGQWKNAQQMADASPDGPAKASYQMQADALSSQYSVAVRNATAARNRAIDTRQQAQALQSAGTQMWNDLQSKGLLDITDKKGMPVVRPPKLSTPQSTQLPTVYTANDYKQLPPGAAFMAPDKNGVVRRWTKPIKP